MNLKAKDKSVIFLITVKGLQWPKANKPTIDKSFIQNYNCHFSEQRVRLAKKQTNDETYIQLYMDDCFRQFIWTI